MNTSTKLLALALLGLGCGPPRLIGDVDAGDGDAESESSDDESSSSSESSTSETGTPNPSTSTTNASDTVILVPHVDDVWQPECDPFAQDCPDGEKCVPYARDGVNLSASKCVPVLGDHAPGEPCVYGGPVESTDDCDATSFCWDPNQEGMGVCHSFCTGTPNMPVCPDGLFCPLTGDTSINLCFPICDPVAQDCGDDLGCYFDGIEFTCVAPADPPGSPPGDACEWANACEIGSLCVIAEALPNCASMIGCCAEFCDLGLGDAQCAAVPGTVCVSFYEQDMAPEGYEHVGICILPP